MLKFISKRWTKHLLRKARKHGIYLYGYDRKVKCYPTYTTRGWCLYVTTPYKGMKEMDRYYPISERKFSWSFKPF